MTDILIIKHVHLKSFPKGLMNIKIDSKGLVMVMVPITSKHSSLE